MWVFEKTEKNKIKMVADVKGGCLHGGNLSRTSRNRQRERGVQVFTYKELEMATEKFNEGNVIGSGGFGVVYRGVLSDGTLAAIKMLHIVGKHGERAFRVEVSQGSCIHLLLPFLFPFALSLFLLKFCHYLIFTSESNCIMSDKEKQTNTNKMAFVTRRSSSIKV